MKSYPKIDYYNKGLFNEQVIAFDKLDGSNMRFEWSKKRKSFYKFGTRGVMIDTSNEQFGKAINIFLEKYQESLSKIFTDKYNKVESFVVFGEYLGENSFAGQHLETDVKDVILFDVNQYKKGFISPYEFVDNFGHLDIPRIIYEGLYTDSFIDDIKNNTYNLTEGVITKGVKKTKKEKDEIWMTKVKTNEWLSKVKEKFGDKYLLEELNNDITLYEITK